MWPVVRALHPVMSSTRLIASPRSGGWLGGRRGRLCRDIDIPVAKYNKELTHTGGQKLCKSNVVVVSFNLRIQLQKVIRWTDSEE